MATSLAGVVPTLQSPATLPPTGVVSERGTWLLGDLGEGERGKGMSESYNCLLYIHTSCSPLQALQMDKDGNKRQIHPILTHLITRVEHGGQGVITGSIFTQGATPGGRTFTRNQTPHPAEHAEGGIK